MLPEAWPGPNLLQALLGHIFEEFSPEILIQQVGSGSLRLCISNKLPSDMDRLVRGAQSCRLLCQDIVMGRGGIAGVAGSLCYMMWTLLASEGGRRGRTFDPS